MRMQKAFYRGRRQILVGFRFNMIWPAGLLLPAGRVCSWDGLTLTRETQYQQMINHLSTNVVEGIADINDKLDDMARRLLA